MERSIMDVPLQELYEKMIYPSRQQQVGDTFRIAHLTSQRGQALNGKTCRVFDFDRDQGDARLHCRILQENDDTEQEATETAKLKATNLVPIEVTKMLDNFMEHSLPISDNDMLPRLEKAIRKHDHETDRADLMHRISLYKSLVQKLNNSKREGQAQQQELQDEDYCMPCGAGSDLSDDQFSTIMTQMKPACVGNGLFDVRHADLGLKGDNQTLCSICTNVLDADTESSVGIVTLPCMHVFHDDCIVQWLGSDLGRTNWNCPSCRAPVPGNMTTYRVNYDEQLQRRFDEYPLSGFCTKCMIWIMERNRNDELPLYEA